jgi:hypothetical protein
MAKILFDISDKDEAIEWHRCYLVMEASRHIFSFTVLNAAKHAVIVRFYELFAENDRDLAEELEEVINADSSLKEKMKERVVIYNFPESHLVPEKYFHINTNKDLVDILHGDLQKGTILSEKILGWNQYNVFRVPTGVHNLFQRRFSNGKYWHYYSLWMECGQKQPNLQSDYLSVVFYPNRMLVAAIENKQLQLLQSINYEVVEDVAYYLLNICAQLQLSPERTPVKLSGMIDEASALYAEIYKYFGNTSLESLPDASLLSAYKEYPPHFFSPLLKLAVCVS